MDERAKKFIDLVLKHEGGYSDDPVDLGGRTYCGITQKSFPQWKGWPIVDQHMPLKRNQIIKGEPIETYVREFYYEQFYLKMKIDKIENECIAGHLFCHGVNAGIVNGVKVLQRAINKTYNANLAVDGKIGSQTLSFANGLNCSDLVDAFIEERNQYYKNIVNRKPAQKKFLNGWLNRVKGTTNACCGKTKNVLLSQFSFDGDFWVRVLKFIFKLIKSLKS